MFSNTLNNEIDTNTVLSKYTPNNSNIPRQNRSLIRRKRQLTRNKTNDLYLKKETNRNVVKKNNSPTTNLILNKKKSSKNQKYKILKKLGEGSNTKVYKAQNNKTGQIVAIKKFSIDVLNDQDSKSYLEVII